MIVRMLVDVSGLRDGASWPAAGETLELPDAEASAYCALGMCEPVRGTVEDRRETADVMTTETVSRRPPGRPRKAT